MSGTKSSGGSSAASSSGPSPLYVFVTKRWRWIVAVIVAAGLVAGARWAYVQVSTRLATDPRFRLDPEQITVTPPPDWVRTNILAEVLRDGSLDNSPSLLDPRLAQRVAKAFEIHPWVARTIEVRKVAPAGLDVKLEYRRPVCMVEVPGGLFAVDEHAVLLPSADFGAADAQKYPRLSGVVTVTEGPVGIHWDDPCVQGAAQIAGVIVDAWNELQLERIVPVAVRGASHTSADYEFDLLTRRGTRIHWGHAPTFDHSHEPSAADKLARLQKYAASRGSLDAAGSPVDLDLRYGNDIVVTPRMAADTDDNDTQKR